MFMLDQVRTTKITEYIMFVITLLILQICECRHIYSVKGKNAQLNFPFPCDSTDVTLQYANRLPFYRFADGSVLSLPQNQANRFKVQTNIENGNCSLDLTISNVKPSDVGTYLSSIYMDGQLLDELTTRIWLGVDSPPDETSCVKVSDKEGDWVAIDCTANIGNLEGKIECYQNGQNIPAVTGPVANYSSVTQSFLIRKSQPAFCCPSILNESKERCECNDVALNLADGESSDPCPPSSTITTVPLISIVSEKNQTYFTGMYSTRASTPTNMKERKNNDHDIIISVVVLLPVLVIIILGSLFVWYKNKKRPQGSREESGAISRLQEDSEAPRFRLDN